MSRTAEETKESRNKAGSEVHESSPDRQQMTMAGKEVEEVNFKALVKDRGRKR